MYLAGALDLEVQLGDPWNNVKKGSPDLAKKLEEHAPLYAVAVGLAMRV